MATGASDAGERSVSIGRIFSRAFGTVGSNPAATFGIAFLFSALPTYLLLYLMIAAGGQVFESLGTVTIVAAMISYVLVAILLAFITQGALVRATVAYGEGGKASFAESATAGLSVAAPLFLLAMISAVGLALGLLLLVVPGIILYIIWSVAAPALVEERLGPIAALGRSRELTRGNRWKIFGLTLVITVVYWLFTALVEVVASLWYSGGGGLTSDSLAGLPLGYVAISVVSATITSAIWGVIQTSLYVELRDWKDGPRTDALAEIFG